MVKFINNNKWHIVVFIGLILTIFENITTFIGIILTAFGGLIIALGNSKSDSRKSKQLSKIELSVSSTEEKISEINTKNNLILEEEKKQTNLLTDGNSYPVFLINGGELI